MKVLGVRESNLNRNLYFLSIHDTYVSMIMDGAKQWEFRRNPAFGIFPEGRLEPGDLIFVVSTFSDPARSPLIRCMVEIQDILRDHAMRDYFSDRASGHWREAGCEEGTDRDWDYFQRNILEEYATAIRVNAYKLEPPIDAASIRHKYKGSPWSGRGFTPAEDLRRFQIDGQVVEPYFRRLAGNLMDEIETPRDPSSRGSLKP